jgi:hypothetical protein
MYGQVQIECILCVHNMSAAYTYIKECKLTFSRNHNLQDQNQHLQYTYLHIKLQNEPSGTKLNINFLY